MMIISFVLFFQFEQYDNCTGLQFGLVFEF